MSCSCLIGGQRCHGCLTREMQAREHAELSARVVLLEEAVTAMVVRERALTERVRILEATR